MPTRRQRAKPTQAAAPTPATNKVNHAHTDTLPAKSEPESHKSVDAAHDDASNAVAQGGRPRRTSRRRGQQAKTPEDEHEPAPSTTASDAGRTTKADATQIRSSTRGKKASTKAARRRRHGAAAKNEPAPRATQATRVKVEETGQRAAKHVAAVKTSKDQEVKAHEGPRDVLAGRGLRRSARLAAPKPGPGFGNNNAKALVPEKSRQSIRRSKRNELTIDREQRHQHTESDNEDTAKTHDGGKDDAQPKTEDTELATQELGGGVSPSATSVSNIAKEYTTQPTTASATNTQVAIPEDEDEELQPADPAYPAALHVWAAVRRRASERAPQNAPTPTAGPTPSLSRVTGHHGPSAALRDPPRRWNSRPVATQPGTMAETIREENRELARLQAKLAKDDPEAWVPSPLASDDSDEGGAGGEGASSWELSDLSTSERSKSESSEEEDVPQEVDVGASSAGKRKREPEVDGEEEGRRVKGRLEVV